MTTEELYELIATDDEPSGNSELGKELVTNLSSQVKNLIISIDITEKSAHELQLVTNLSPKSLPLFRKQFLYPAVKAGLVAMTHPEKLRSSKQKYYLTELGSTVREILLEQQNNNLENN